MCKQQLESNNEHDDIQKQYIASNQAEHENRIQLNKALLYRLAVLFHATPFGYRQFTDIGYSAMQLVFRIGYSAIYDLVFRIVRHMLEKKYWNTHGISIGTPHGCPTSQNTVK